MAFKKEQIEKLESALGIPTGQFDVMYKDIAEKEIPIDDYEIMKKSDFSERLKNEKKSEFDKGKSTGMEIQTREVIKAFGLDVDKNEPLDKIADAAKAKIVADANITPDAKEKEWKKEKLALQGTITTLQTEKGTLETTFKQKENAMKIDSFIKEKMPVKGMVLEPGKLAVLFKTDYTPDLDTDGKVIFKKDGEVVKNTITQNPKTIDEILPEWQKPYIGKAAGGAAGKDEPGTGGSTEWDAFEKEMRAKGYPPGHPEFNKERRARKIKAN